MESKDFWIIVVLGFSLLLGSIFYFILNKTSQEKEETKTYKIYHMKYGGAFCGQVSFHGCGITLRKCTDDKEYYCMHDVSVEMDK